MSMIHSTVLIQFTHVTDGLQTDKWTVGRNCCGIYAL